MQDDTKTLRIPDNCLKVAGRKYDFWHLKNMEFKEIIRILGDSPTNYRLITILKYSTSDRSRNRVCAPSRFRNGAFSGITIPLRSAITMPNSFVTLIMLCMRFVCWGGGSKANTVT